MVRIRRDLESALRRLPVWAVYVLGLMPAGWLWYLGLTGGLGPEPIRAMELELGETGLQFLLATLAVSPVRRFTGLSLLRFRRALGLLSFWYLLQHVSVWLVLDLRDPALIWADIVKRPYITAGMVGFLALVPLALTSSDRALRWLGAAKWRSLHRLTYVVAGAAVVHVVLLVKGWPLEPLLYTALAVVLLALRLVPGRRRVPAGGVTR